MSSSRAWCVGSLRAAMASCAAPWCPRRRATSTGCNWAPRPCTTWRPLWRGPWPCTGTSSRRLRGRCSKTKEGGPAHLLPSVSLGGAQLHDAKLRLKDAMGMGGAHIQDAEL
uniref:Uncharacterized protein n=1 Tax=Ixodes ricinus TaxID=34613 RepID=A0A6B0UJS6_IXORI